MTILVYMDEGAGPRSVRLLLKSLKSLDLGGHVKLRRANRQVIAHENWEAHTRLLIFPGGRDVPYHQILKGKPNGKIRNYVENGGNYLGICAGGYYGCAAIEFEKGHPLEVVSKRELGFFPGTAQGSAYGPNRFKYQDESGSHAASLHWLGEPPLDTPLSIYFNGGCLFHDAHKHPNTRVLARYADLPNSPAAIIECSVGKGKALLSGVHPEYSFPHLEQVASVPKAVLSALKESEAQRQKLFYSLISRSFA